MKVVISTVFLPCSKHQEPVLGSVEVEPTTMPGEYRGPLAVRITLKRECPKKELSQVIPLSDLRKALAQMVGRTWGSLLQSDIEAVLAKHPEAARPELRRDIDHLLGSLS